MADKPLIDLSKIRNRVIELRYMRPGELKDHPGQWRAHTESQAKAMIGVLEEIGQAGALIAWYSEREGGALTTFDGHLRKSLDPNLKWPVLITDLTDEEADYALATYDPISALAGADRERLDALLSSVHSSSDDVRQLLSGLAEREGLEYEQAEEEAEMIYSRNIEAPIYEPKGEKPNIHDLYDDSKTKALIAEIDASGLPEEEKEFLRVAARRHTVLNYKRIADYYAHSSPEVQALMENSALVIIDFNKAIEQGYIELSHELAKQYEIDYGD